MGMVCEGGRCVLKEGSALSGRALMFRRKWCLDERPLAAPSARHFTLAMQARGGHHCACFGRIVCRPWSQWGQTCGARV
jgi:hypothetical protein